MIYELRTYTAMPGRLPDLHTRFETITSGYFAKHGIRVVGYWTYQFGGPNDQLVYMLAYDSLADREAKWATFDQDAERRAAFAKTEENGKLVQRITVQILRPTPYSPKP